MRLYHGTSGRLLRTILENGLWPRGEVGDGNWKEFPSREDMVYLTDAYPFFFAVNNCENEDFCVVFEVETGLMVEELLHPDEDFVAQTLAHQRNKSLSEIHEKVKGELEFYQHHWKDSLERLGTCAYQDVIEPKAITRYCKFHPSQRVELAMNMMDPSISLMNYFLLADKYRNLTQWMFGDVPTYNPMSQYGFPDNPVLAEQNRFWEMQSKDRTGIEVVTLKG